MFSCIYQNRNEIWCLINDDIYIFNYFQKEWVKRYEQPINTVCLIKNNVHTGGNNIIYVENINNNYNGVFYPVKYKTTFINFGSNSNLKKQKTPLLLVLNDAYRNDFWVKLTVNNKTKNAKRVRIKGSGGGVYGSGNTTYDIIPDNMKYGTARYAKFNPYSKKVVEISTPQTWYTLSVEIYTDMEGQGFYINSMELKNVKEKLKTRGR
jgi:hypothetical protein